jgi:hypothetical protein
VGRTSRRKQIKIAELRQQGYTQEETAKKLKTTVKTVRKYDPLRQAKTEGVPQGPPKASPLEISTELLNKMKRKWGEPLHVDPSSPIEDQLAALGQWVEALILKAEGAFACPNCFKGNVEYAEWQTPDGTWDGAYVCPECGYPMPSIAGYWQPSSP